MRLILEIVLFDIVAMAPLCAWLAVQRGRSPSGWFILGALIGPFALATLGAAPTAWELRERRARTRPCDRCLSLVPDAATRCHACGATLQPAPRLAGSATPTTVAASGSMDGDMEADVAPPSLPTRPVALPASGSRRQAAPMARPVTVPVPEPRPFLVAVKEPASEPPPSPSAQRAEAPRVTAVPAATQPRPPRRRRLIPSDIVPVTSGALVGGDLSVGIGELGERFLVGTADESVVVFGPIGSAQEKVVLEAPRDSVEVTRVPDGFVLTSEPDPGRRVRITFRNTASTEVERAIALLDPDNRPIAHLPHDPAEISSGAAEPNGRGQRSTRTTRRARSTS